MKHVNLHIHTRSGKKKQPSEEVTPAEKEGHDISYYYEKTLEQVRSR